MSEQREKQNSGIVLRTCGRKKKNGGGRGPQIADEVKMSDKATRLLTQDGFYRLGESCECRWRVGTIISARLPECTE